MSAGHPREDGGPCGGPYGGAAGEIGLGQGTTFSGLTDTPLAARAER